MTNALATTQAITTSADSDQMLVQLFINTKRSANTRTQYSHSITMLLDFTGKPLQALTLQDALAYHEWLKERYSVGSVRLHVDVAKALCGFGVKLNYLRTNVFAPVKCDAAPSITHKRILTEEETLKLIDAPRRQRDKLLLRLIYAGGLRVGEVCNLVWGDLLLSGVLHIRQGKGQKERFVTLSDGMIEKLAAFRAQPSFAGDAASPTKSDSPDLVGMNEPMFKSQKGGQLDASQVHRIVKAAAQAAGLSSDASAHWLRHSHASHALDRGASLVTVRDTLGHASIATTNKYLHSKRKDSSALHLAV